MKKIIILASLIAFTGLSVMAEDCKEAPKTQVNAEQIQKIRQQKKAEFDNKLKLTDEQKAQAEVMREKNHAQMKPLIEQAMAKRKELKSAIDSNKDYKTVESLKKELGDLEKQIHEIKRQNMKDFEGILTNKQKKELEKIKQEGRKKFEQEHRNKHPKAPKEEFKPQIVLP